MITLIYGKSGSGKSAFAEAYVCGQDSKYRYYLATMAASDDEAIERIKKHRSQRKDKGFITLEHTVDVPDAIDELDDVSMSDGIMLLECMSNLVANEMFRGGECKTSISVAEKILDDINILAKSVSSLVIVSNDIFDDGMEYDEATREYMRCMGLINKELAQISDEIYEVVVGIGIKL